MYSTPIALAIIALGVYFVVRRVDVRLVLGLCAAALFALALQLPQFFIVFAKEMTNERTVVPICSAMGFAYVVKLTECDRHLINLLVEPLRHARALLIPGGVAVGFLVNTAIVSQSSTAATVGPVMIPLLLAAGISPSTAGALLLLGASVGGELFNPGAVEIVTLSSITGAGATTTVERVMPANLLASGTALAVFWRMAVLHERRWKAEGATAGDAQAPEAEKPAQADDVVVPLRINPIKALVPVLPLALLFVMSVAQARGIVVLPAELTDSVRISASMLVGVLAAWLTAPTLGGQVAASFFEGAGYAYARVISLIITATVFTESIKANGLIEILSRGLSASTLAVTLASIILPWLLAVTCGSGIAPAVAVMKVLVPVASEVGLDPTRIGALTAVAAQLGRTMSPAAAVVMMSSAVSGESPVELLRRVTWPLVAAVGVLCVAAAAGVL